MVQEVNQDKNVSISSINGACLPRSIRWRIQLGLLKVPKGGGGVDEMLTESESLVQAQRERYDEYLSLYDTDRIECINQERKDEKADEKIKLDPLSFLAQEKEAKEANNRRDKMNRMKSSLADVIKSQDILKIVRKDLNRLPNDHSSFYRNKDNPAENEEQKVQERNEILTEILHIFAKRNKEIGYGQGMHELSSYCLLAIEMDLIDAESANCSDYQNVMSYKYLRHDSFSLFEALMGHMKHAYTHLEEETSEEEKCHEEFGIIEDTILHKTLYISNDKSLYTHLQKMEFSTSLYCARWLRLMFAREAGGMQSTLKLWDVFFDCITTETGVASNGKFGTGTRREESQRMSLIGKFKLKPVLEMTAASLLWLHKDYIFSRNPDEALQEIHGQCILENLTPLVTALLDGLRNLKKSSIKAKCKSTRQRSLSPPQKVSPKFGKRLSMTGWIAARNSGKGGAPSLPAPNGDDSKSAPSTENYSVHKHRGSLASSIKSCDTECTEISTRSSHGVRSITPENDLLEGFPGCDADDDDDDEEETFEYTQDLEEEKPKRPTTSLLSRRKSKADLLLTDLETSQHLFHESLDILPESFDLDECKTNGERNENMNSDSEAETQTKQLMKELESSQRSLSFDDLANTNEEEKKSSYQPHRRPRFSRRGSLPKSHIVKVEEVHSLLQKNKSKAQILLADLMASESRLFQDSFSTHKTLGSEDLFLDDFPESMRLEC